METNKEDLIKVRKVGETIEVINVINFSGALLDSIENFTDVSKAEEHFTQKATEYGMPSESTDDCLNYGYYEGEINSVIITHSILDLPCDDSYHKETSINDIEYLFVPACKCSQGEVRCTMSAVFANGFPTCSECETEYDLFNTDEKFFVIENNN